MYFIFWTPNPGLFFPISTQTPIQNTHTYTNNRTDIHTCTTPTQTQTSQKHTRRRPHKHVQTKGKWLSKKTFNEQEMADCGKYQKLTDYTYN